MVTRSDLRLDFGDTVLNYVANECREDLKAYCSDIKSGEGRLLRCIDKNSAKVSSRCTQAMKDTGLKKKQREGRCSAPGGALGPARRRVYPMLESHQLVGLPAGMQEADGLHQQSKKRESELKRVKLSWLVALVRRMPRTQAGCSKLRLTSPQLEGGQRAKEK
jgi:hypothetical protein